MQKTAYHVDDAIQSEDIIAGSRQTCFFSMKEKQGMNIFYYLCQILTNNT